MLEDDRNSERSLLWAFNRILTCIIDHSRGIF